MKGVVVKSTGSWYNVANQNNTLIKCRIKGKIRLQGIKHTNPVAVGDIVSFNLEPGRDTGVISSIEERRNYIIRKSNNLSKQTHIIASNIDLAVIIVTPEFPKTSFGFIDRFLASAEAYHINAVIVFNKTDLFVDELKQKLNKFLDIYGNKVGYKCLEVSVKNKTGLDAFKQLLKNKTTLITGHSGTGKSSIINAIEPGLKLKTSDISHYSLKGKHTTTFAEMHPLSFGGYIIDTPGIREFGLTHIKPEELSHYFIEMRPFIGYCKFNNCKHINEPGCAVINALHNHIITTERYNSYLGILNNHDIYA